MSLAVCLSPSRRAIAFQEDLCDGLAAFGAFRLPEAALLALDVPVSPARACVLDRTPVEVIVEVFRNLDLKTVFALAVASKRFAAIFATHRVSIILPIARREFSPFAGLLQAVKAKREDLDVPWGTWLDKRVRRNHDVLCEGGLMPESLAEVPADVSQEAVLVDADVDRILAVCKVVRGWERIFPQHRFNASPLSTRSLTARENERLRGALYIWMRYAYYFHGELPRPNLFVPSGRDLRVNQLRALSNSGLRALRDLWVTVEDVIELLCPSVDNVRIGADFELSEKDAARIGWGEARENETIRATIAKLGPDELLHYLENRHRFSKTMLVREIRQKHPHFEFDIESLGSALACVEFERCRRARAVHPSTLQDYATCLPMYSRMLGDCGGGVLDWEDAEAQQECASVGEMAGLNLDIRPDESFINRPEIPPGLLHS